MNKFQVTLLLLLGTFGLQATTAYAQVCAKCPSFPKSQSAATKKLSSLVGCWKGKGPNNFAAKIIYELGSDQTALLEKISVEKNPTMYTVYYLDGEAQMAHHFCSYGNQEMMRSELTSDPNTLLFKYVDGTNMIGHDPNHMTYVKFMFRDQDHFDVEWGLHHGGKDIPQPFTFRRVMEGCSTRFDEW